jgi:hypothetical protein
MTWPGTLPSGAKTPRTGGMDRWISRAAAATVAGLAVIADAINYSHMRQPAQDHGQAGWHAYAFPLSVDGIEIVASPGPAGRRRLASLPGPRQGYELRLGGGRGAYSTTGCRRDGDGWLAVVRLPSRVALWDYRCDWMSHRCFLALAAGLWRLGASSSPVGRCLA